MTPRAFDGIVFPLPMGTSSKKLPHNLPAGTVKALSCDCPYIEHIGSGKTDDPYVAIYRCKDPVTDQPPGVYYVHIVIIAVGLKLETKALMNLLKFPLPSVLKEAVLSAPMLLAAHAEQERSALQHITSAHFVRN